MYQDSDQYEDDETASPWMKQREGQQPPVQRPAQQPQQEQPGQEQGQPGRREQQGQQGPYGQSSGMQQPRQGTPQTRMGRQSGLSQSSDGLKGQISYWKKVSEQENVFVYGNLRNKRVMLAAIRLDQQGRQQRQEGMGTQPWAVGLIDPRGRVLQWLTASLSSKQEAYRFAERWMQQNPVPNGRRTSQRGQGGKDLPSVLEMRQYMQDNKYLSNPMFRGMVNFVFKGWGGGWI